MTSSSPPAPEERLLILASFCSPTEAERAQAAQAAAALRSWSIFREMAEHNATVPLVQRNLERLGLLASVPAAVRAAFERRSESIRAANSARLAAARTLLARLAGRGVDVVILKGVLFAETIYGDPFYKKMNDLDILIRFADLDAIYEVFAELDYFSAAELVGGNPRKQEKFSHHAPPFFSPDLACMVGTHWGLITPLAPYRLDYAAIWSRVARIDFGGVAAFSMAPEDNLHHLCVHLPYYKTGIRELADIYNLVRHFRDRLDWDLFASEVARARTENLVHHALSLASRIAPMEEMEAAIRRIEPRVSWYFRRDTARKTASLSRLLRSRSVHMSTIEKCYGDLNLTQKAFEKWQAWARMWFHILLPPAADVERMNALENPGPLRRLAARFVTPWRIFRVFARDVGALVFCAIMAKCLADCLRAAVAPKTRKVVDLAAFARNRGLAPEDLQRLKDSLE